MGTQFIHNIDLNKNQVQNAAVHNLSSAPSNPVKGQQYFNTTDNKAYIYNGSAWVENTIPSQSGQSGKFLTTDGTASSWANVDALPSQTGQSGKFLTTDGTDASWSTVDALPSQTGNSGKFLTTNGTAASWATINTSTSTSGTFTASNWTSSNSKYVLTISLTNTPENANIIFYDSNNQQVFPEAVTLTKSSGNITSVTATIGSDPDCRFAGSYSIFY